MAESGFEALTTLRPVDTVFENWGDRGPDDHGYARQMFFARLGEDQLPDALQTLLTPNEVSRLVHSLNFESGDDHR